MHPCQKLRGEGALYVSKRKFHNCLTFKKNIFSSKKRWGVCRDPEPCSEKGDIYWPRDGTCYPKLTKGPCPKGELLVVGEDGLATCSCSENGELGRYYWPGEGGGCYEHYTQGPCVEAGELFLPGGNCGCHSDLPHYYVPNKMCYQLGKLIVLHVDVSEPLRRTNVK